MTRHGPRDAGWTLLAFVVAVAGLAFLAGTAAAHGGLSGGGRESVEMPAWLFLSTGGGVVGASFLLASFVTDRSLVAAIHGWGVDRSVPATWSSRLRLVGGSLGALVLVFLAVAAFLGPRHAEVNAAILLVWAGWWAGFTMVVYLVGNVWPLVNPWRALADWPGAGPLSYPSSLGAWPSVAGLLALVWLEVVSPVTADPRLLGTVVVAYSVVTVAGALAYGPDVWFRRVDPVSRVFRYYGRFAPVTVEGSRLTISWPGSQLSETKLVDGVDEVAFVVAILWVTTYDGFVSTATGAAIVEWQVGVGVPPLLAYLLLLLAGFAVFFGTYRAAMRAATDLAETPKPESLLLYRFAPTLLPIAVGYHLAHFFGYFVSLLPSLAAALTAPISGVANPQLFVLPDWFGALSVAFVLVGHLIAIWVAHATAFSLFPGRLQAIRSQYPLVGAMVFYTMLSLWIVTRPSVELAYL